jgi:hypothetical protein
MKHRDTASFGKRQEFQAIAKLLELDFDVYSTLIDDIGIDCVIRINNKRYLDIQIKARSIEKCILKNRGFFPQIKIDLPSNNYFLVLYAEEGDNYWVIPSKDVVKMANEGGFNISKMKKGKKAGTYSVRVAGAKGNPLPQFDKYINEKGFKLLK